MNPWLVLFLCVVVFWLLSSPTLLINTLLIYYVHLFVWQLFLFYSLLMSAVLCQFVIVYCLIKPSQNCFCFLLMFYPSNLFMLFFCFVLKWINDKSHFPSPTSTVTSRASKIVLFQSKNKIILIIPLAEYVTYFTDKLAWFWLLISA